MAEKQAESGFLRSRAARILTVVLAAQAALLYGFSRSEIIPDKQPLEVFPKQVSEWNLLQEHTLEKEIQDVLKADETLSRSYGAPGRPPAHLFVAYFKTQRTGQAPHSPKNCLPGNGWVWTVNDIIHVPVTGRDPIEVNRYVIARGDSKSVVLYWYQSRDRVVASEYKAKFFVVADAMRYNRTDTALVKVTVPVANNDEAAAMRTALEFVQTFYTPVRQHLPA
jgi:EpsI family protein